MFYETNGITEFLGIGTNSYVGIVDETTVLKYPHIPGDKSALAILGLEARMLEVIGPHKHIIKLKGQTKDGLLLERAHFGSIAQYLKNNDPPLQQRMEWTSQATKAIAIVHRARVLHRDIGVNNLLSDAKLNVKLCGFRGRFLGPVPFEWKVYSPSVEIAAVDYHSLHSARGLQRYALVN